MPNSEKNILPQFTPVYITDAFGQIDKKIKFIDSSLETFTIAFTTGQDLSTQELKEQTRKAEELLLSIEKFRSGLTGFANQKMALLKKSTLSSEDQESVVDAFTTQLGIQSSKVIDHQKYIEQSLQILVLLTEIKNSCDDLPKDKDDLSEDKGKKSIKSIIGTIAEQTEFICSYVNDLIPIRDLATWVNRAGFIVDCIVELKRSISETLLKQDSTDEKILELQRTLDNLGYFLFQEIDKRLSLF